ncbi:hypothetical protein [Breoghania sp. L-A4]|uniref:hypothetical protein n=1 Tax=Breoghania sp. L-A4 TaxID=2304600 RepID=UPI0020C031B9|nr:hypothetical protein [Breoghania sp. L-A4]
MDRLDRGRGLGGVILDLALGHLSERLHRVADSLHQLLTRLDRIVDRQGRTTEADHDNGREGG